MHTKADKAAGIAMGIFFFLLGIWGLFALPSDWVWHQKVLLEVLAFGCSLMCFSAAFLGIPGSRK
ncbi:MAG: hypothetical protein OXL37_12830 [Chloroflexota bacterium]|nr:hypothetical protein [Chloroflexota bacterium]MDE2960127.1 hypothetical protein [Chloroflexota bacterium]